MSYFGKEFKVVGEENFADFIKVLNLPAEETAKLAQFKPISKLVKDGDGYKYYSITSEGTKETPFKSGVEFEDEPRPGLKVKTKYTVEGDTVTQEISRDGKTVTFKRDYSKENELIVTITASFWDGKAIRYYKA